MQNKRRLYKHLMIIYVFYFVALVIGFLSTIAPSFSSGWREAQQKYCFKLFSILFRCGIC